MGLNCQQILVSLSSTYMLLSHLEHHIKPHKIVAPVVVAVTCISAQVRCGMEWYILVWERDNRWKYGCQNEERVIKHCNSRLTFTSIIQVLYNLAEKKYVTKRHIVADAPHLESVIRREVEQRFQARRPNAWTDHHDAYRSADFLFSWLLHDLPCRWRLNTHYH